MVRQTLGREARHLALQAKKLSEVFGLMQNHFSDLEAQVRQYLADPERRANALEDLAQEILRQMAYDVPQRVFRGGQIRPSAGPNIRFTGAIVQGVASVIADELGIPTNAKKQLSKK